MIKKLHDLFKPENYDLHLDINTKDSEFSGIVEISGEIAYESSMIELHSKDLKIVSATINGKKAYFSFGDHDTLKLQSEKELNAGQIKINIEFSGAITDHMHGMYPCYFNHEGKRKKLIATQFESHHAREVFPCVDEPSGKATFDLELVTNANETVLANTPVKKQRAEHTRLITRFETTPKMSPYLLAFVTGEMIGVEAKTKSGITVKSWASKAQDPSFLNFSVSEAVAYIDFYEEYFGVKYPLSKCDQVALPDFESGAMENWGLITYRESVMLDNPANPSLSTRQYIAIVTAHELAHQWFGNLVTMRWWDDLWLNESFASIIEYIAVDHIHPEWHMWEDYISADAINAINRDVYLDVQPVRVEVNDPEVIHTIFDPSIVYAKGGKLLKALHDFIGEDAWRKGLKNYFKTHAYSNTTGDDLWEALAETSGADVAGLMNTWLEQPGLPKVSVTQHGHEVELEQKRLLLDGTDEESTWIIPLANGKEVSMLATASQSIEMKSYDWIMLNHSGIGHFVTDYTVPAHKKWIAQQIHNPKQPSTWKIARLNELIMLARHGDTDLTEALNGIKGSSDEQRAAVWSQIATVIGHARNLTVGHKETRYKIRSWMYALVEAHYEKLGWAYKAEENSNTTHMRTTVLSIAMGSRNEQAIKKALEIYALTPDIANLPSEIRTNILGVAVRRSKDPDVAQELLKTYTMSHSAELRSDICVALTSTHKKEDYTHLISLMTDTTIVRTQDTIRWFVYLLRNRHSRDATWHWLKENWNWVEKTFGGSKSYDDFARYSASIFNTEEWLKRYTAFFSDKQADPTLKRTIAIGIKEIEARVAWRERDEQKIVSWFENH